MESGMGRSMTGGRVHVGRFVLEIGAPEGTRAHFAPSPPGADPSELALALSQPAPSPTIVGMEGALGEAASVTSRVERALELFTAVAEGRVLDRNMVLKETDAILGALERADREGRHADVLRLARALSLLLGLLMRWVALADTLKTALRAARALGDLGGEAWARHELGTLALPAEDAQAARLDLEEALELRHEIRDQRGEAVTRHNLDLLEEVFGRGGMSKGMIALIVVLAALLLGAIGFGVGKLMGDDEEPAPTVSTVADVTPPTVELLSTPENPTEERSATFEFEADEEVSEFQCRLDDGSFEPCESPFNIPGPLDFDEHEFRVRAVDLAGNRGDAARFTWTVERGEGPAVTIIDGPPPLTNQTTATFIIDPGDALSLECRLADETPFAPCPTQTAIQVSEGEHTFVVRGLDAENTTGPPARYSWTVDTTPPTVEIGDIEADDTTASVPFTVSEEGSTVECVLFLWVDTDSDAEVSDDELEEVETVDECTSPAEFEELDPETDYVVRVTATDPAGNEGEPAEESFTTTGP